MPARAPKHKRRQQLKKRLKTRVAESVTVRDGQVRATTYETDALINGGAPVTRSTKSMTCATGGLNIATADFDRIADTGTQAVTVTIRGCRDSRRKLRHYQSARGYRLLNDGNPIQVTGELESFGIGLRGLEPESVDWLKQQLWVKSVQVTTQALSGEGTEYRRMLEQLKHTKQTKAHDPLRRGAGNWGG